jgi:hypothetical protein
MNCVSCQTELQGDYCHACGEKRADKRELSLPAILQRAADALTDVDSRFYATYRALITRPGSLTADYAQGRTVEWFSPFETMLLTTIFFFFYHTTLGRPTVFALPLDLQLQDRFYGSLIRDLLTDRFGSLHTMTFAAFRMRFDLILQEYSKVLVIMMAPPLALIMALLRINTREPLAMHFAFALHVLCVLMLALIATPAVLWIIAGPLPPKAAFWLLSDSVFLAVVGFGMWLHLFAALKRAYSVDPIFAAPLAVVVCAVLFALAHAYRFALFFVVYHIV